MHFQKLWNRLNYQDAIHADKSCYGHHKCNESIHVHGQLWVYE